MKLTTLRRFLFKHPVPVLHVAPSVRSVRIAMALSN